MKVFEGHKGDIAGLAFSSHGTLLASYAATDAPPTVKVWTVADAKESGGLFGRLIGGGAKDTAVKDCVKTFTLSAIPPPSRANSYYSAQQSTVRLK